MEMYCQECGKKVEDSFQFCPFCGKKLIKPKICSNCGAKLKENFTFCPECGKKWDSSEKPLISKSKKTEKTGIEAKVASPKRPLKFLKNFKRPSKKVLTIISVVFVVLVVAAAMIVFYPFNNANSNNAYGGRTFSINIENNYSGNVNCNLKVGALHYGEDDFLISSGESFTTAVLEDSLNSIILNNDYDITLYLSSDDGESQATAFGVTESATFVISGDAGSINVNCTESQ